MCFFQPPPPDACLRVVYVSTGDPEAELENCAEGSCQAWSVLVSDLGINFSVHCVLNLDYC
jgi:hypothetical protein